MWENWWQKNTRNLILCYIIGIPSIECRLFSFLLWFLFVCCFPSQASGLNTKDDDAILKLLVKASGQFGFVDKNRQLFTLLSDNRFGEMYEPIVRNARSLVEQCRHQIRHSLGQCYLPDVILTLPVPTKLHDFLLLKGKHYLEEDDDND